MWRIYFLYFASQLNIELHVVVVSALFGLNDDASMIVGP